MKKRGSGKIFVGVALGLFVVAIVFLVVGLSFTVKGITDAIVIRDPSAILASEGVTDGRPVLVPTLYRDLDGDGVLRGEEVFAEKNLGDLMTWFSMIDEVNPSYTGDLRLDYKADGAEFSYSEEKLYPLSDTAASYENSVFGGDDVGMGSHNRLFAMTFGIPFTVLSSGDEMFEVNAKGNTLVFVDDKLVIDIDGLNRPMTGVLRIHGNGEVFTSINGGAMTYSGVDVARDKSAIIKVFHLVGEAEEAIFNMKFAGMSPILSNMSQGGSSIHLAYDPSGPPSVTTLGVSKIYKAGNAKDLIIVATVEGTALAISLVVIVGVIKKQKKKRIQLN